MAHARENTDTQITKLAESFRRQLQREIHDAGLPDGFYDTFKFTTTGKNFCHPITVSLIANAVSRLRKVKYVAIDVRLNLGGGVKFQPDVVGFTSNNFGHVLYVDFESPNSCDTRIKTKDIEPYRKWVRQHPVSVHYVVVTSLPDRHAPNWQLRWTSGQSESGRNRKHKPFLAEIRQNPLRYWQNAWKKDLKGEDLSTVTFLNIDGVSVRNVDIQVKV